MNNSNLAHEPPRPQGEVVRFPKNERKAMSEKKFNYVTSIRSIKISAAPPVVLWANNRAGITRVLFIINKSPGLSQ